MKELSVEEKAKRYDEALIRGSKLWESDMITRENYEYIFPEVKESENIKIIKAIKYGLDHVFTNNTTVFEVTKEQCLSWLEKQGEHDNFRNKIQIGDKVTRNEDGVLVNLSKLNRVAKKQGEQNQKHFELKAGHWYICHRAYCCRPDNLTVKEGERFMCEKDGVAKGFVIKEPEKYFKEVSAPAPMEDEQKPVTHKYNVGATIYYKSFGGIKSMVVANVIDTGDGNPMYEDADGNDVFEKDLILQMHVEEQEPAWSEEDESNRIIIEGELLSSQRNANPYEHATYDKLISWVNSIKDRVLPQPKQEWSEEDLYMQKQAIKCVNNSGKLEVSTEEIEDWLKSLRPQTIWKPSNEQMDAVKSAALDVAKFFSRSEQLRLENEPYYKALVSLYNDLEKLREE